MWMDEDGWGWISEIFPRCILMYSSYFTGKFRMIVMLIRMHAAMQCYLDNVLKISFRWHCKAAYIFNMILPNIPFWPFLTY